MAESISGLTNNSAGVFFLATKILTYA